jgi:hypothetical protein
LCLKDLSFKAFSLKDQFSESVTLFYNTESPTTIYGIFDPEVANSSRDFRVNLGFNSIACDEEGEGEGKKKVKLNKESILKEIEILGGTFVKVEMT